MPILNASREGRVLKLVLNRPEKRNALNGQLCRELVTAIEDAGQDDGVGAILLSGAGPAFCAGMDLDEMLTPEAATLAEAHERLFTIGRRLTVPLIAAVQGPALAGGTGLAANAHIVVAAEDATFGLTEIRIGLWPFVIYRAVVDAVGDRRALELSITGRIVSAPQAADMGLAHYLAPADSLLDHAGAIATAAAAASPVAMRTGLKFATETRGMDPAQAGESARRYREFIFSTPEFAEGIRAFREKHARRS